MQHPGGAPVPSHARGPAAAGWAALLLLSLGALACEAFAIGDATPADGPAATEIAPSPRFTRLSHAQWENSLRDLLRLEPTAKPYSASFRADPRQSGFIFSANALAMEVDQALWTNYQRAAADVAAHVTGDPTRLARILPPATMGDAERARAFIRDVGLRAHRRPLDDVDTAAYLALFEQGAALVDGVPPFVAGVRVVLEAMLLSPHFLYRIERSSTADGAVVPLDGYEVASRLSFMLWNTMPDETLFAAAATGELTRPSGVGTQVQRMLADARAADALYTFHRQLHDVDRFDVIAPSKAFFASAPARLGELAEKEYTSTVRALYARGAGLREMLTTTDSFVDASLARIHGLAGTFGADLVPAKLDPAIRRGLFTQIGFLASHATPVDPDPIHRGVFIAKRVACIPVSAPPGMVPPLPPPGNRTNRETVEAHTEAPGTACAGCHTAIVNPFGFPFEMYDAIGAHRTMDRGKPVNTVAAPLIDGQPTMVRDAVELMDRLAGARSTHECYARHLLEFAHGRPSVDQDAGVITQLGARSLSGNPSIKDLVVALVTSPAFLNRSVEELP